MNENSNIPALFRSRRFWSAIVGLIVILIANFMPELEPNVQDIADNVVLIIGVLIGGFTLTDMAESQSKK